MAWVSVEIAWCACSPHTKRVLLALAPFAPVMGGQAGAGGLKGAARLILMLASVRTIVCWQAWEVALGVGIRKLLEYGVGVTKVGDPEFWN